MAQDVKHTPDGRYIVVMGKEGPRLWRATKPSLSHERRAQLTKELMDARRAIRSTPKGSETYHARERIHAAKVALGERGPIWWTDGSPDLNRRLIKNTPYADWWSTQRD